jgi:hypothetical protein
VEPFEAATVVVSWADVLPWVERVVLRAVPLLLRSVREVAELLLLVRVVAERLLEPSERPEQREWLESREQQFVEVQLWAPRQRVGLLCPPMVFGSSEPADLRQLARVPSTVCPFERMRRHSSPVLPRLVRR